MQQIKNSPCCIKPSRTIFINVESIGEILITHGDQNVVILENLFPDGQSPFVDLHALLYRVEIEQIEAVVHQRVGILRMAVNFVQLTRQRDGLLYQETGLAKTAFDNAGF